VRAADRRREWPVGLVDKTELSGLRQVARLASATRQTFCDGVSGSSIASAIFVKSFVCLTSSQLNLLLPPFQAEPIGEKPKPRQTKVFRLFF
jgi:hypothetical protein